METKVAPTIEARYTISMADEDPADKLENRPPAIAGAAAATLPVGERLTHVDSVGKEENPAYLRQKQEQIERSIIAAEQAKSESFVKNDDPQKIVVVEHPAANTGSTQQPTTQQDLISRREFLQKSGGTALRVAAPIAVVAAAGPVGETEQSKNFFQALGGLFNKFGQRKNEVSQAAAAIPGQVASAAAPVGEVLGQLTLNSDQKAALEALTKPDTLKSNYTVIDDPDVAQNGLAFRNAPHIPLPNEAPNAIDRLKPGETITDAIYWKTEKPEFSAPADASKGPNWVAYKRGEKVGFSYAGYLRVINQSANQQKQ